jgi:ribosome-associated protein
VNDIDDDAPNEADERPSRAARHPPAQRQPKQGVGLVELREAELESLDLPEPLLLAVREARRLTSHSAQARQRQYIGKLMRDVDPAPIEKLLAARAGNPLHRAKMPR